MCSRLGLKVTAKIEVKVTNYGEPVYDEVQYLNSAENLLRGCKVYGPLDHRKFWNKGEAR